MPQFAVYRNPGRDSSVPFLVQLQSTRLEHSTERVVIALRRRLRGGPADHHLTPHLSIQGVAVFADPLNIATVRASLLKHVLEILPEPDQDRIIRAIDEMISRA